VPCLTASSAWIRCLAYVQVNPNSPEANGPFLVFSVENMQGVKAEERFSGYSIQTLADVRYILEDPNVEFYTASVWKEDSILVKVPSWAFTALYNRDDINRSGQVEDIVIDAMDDARHEFDSNKANREWRYYLLQFPPGVVLSSKVIYPDAGDDNELDYEIVKVESTHAKAGTLVEHWLYFQVARVDVRAAKRGKVEKKDKKSKGANKLANLMSG